MRAVWVNIAVSWYHAYYELVKHAHQVLPHFIEETNRILVIVFTFLVN
jgi:hypothetical protein